MLYHVADKDERSITFSPSSENNITLKTMAFLILYILALSTAFDKIDAGYCGKID
jgi:hypothetical protein